MDKRRTVPISVMGVRPLTVRRMSLHLLNQAAVVSAGLVMGNAQSRDSSHRGSHITVIGLTDATIAADCVSVTLNSSRKSSDFLIHFCQILYGDGRNVVGV